jgi:hypothetical protein
MNQNSEYINQQTHQIKHSSRQDSNSYMFRHRGDIHRDSSRTKEYKSTKETSETKEYKPTRQL